MRKLLSLTVVLLLVAMSSCEKKEPTALTDETIVGKATIWGYVSYLEETDYEHVSGATVNVDLDLKSINPKASGSKRYTTTTNASGYYEIVVPTLVGAASDVTVSTTFLANCKVAGNKKMGLFTETKKESCFDGTRVNVNIKIATPSGFPNDQDMN